MLLTINTRIVEYIRSIYGNLKKNFFIHMKGTNVLTNDKVKDWNEFQQGRKNVTLNKWYVKEHMIPFCKRNRRQYIIRIVANGRGKVVK